jgi:RNA polymerase sigma-70 factor (ECF subfamily)
VALESGRRGWRQRWFTITGASAANEVAVPDAGSNAAEQDQLSRQLRAALQNLPQRQREVLHLVFYGGLTLEEAAHTLGLTIGSVRTHYQRGKSRLAELLELHHE